jgi:integrase/recombinase XerD
VTFRYRREPLSRLEAEQLLRACETPFEVSVLTVLLGTGLRVAEFCRAELADFDHQGRTLRVRGKRGPHGTSQPVRLVPVTDHAIRVQLEALLHTNGNRVSRRTIQRLVSDVARRACLTRKVSPHVLRHTFAVEATRRGISTPALQRALGHDHLSSTQVYQNLSAADVVDEFTRKW